MTKATFADWDTTPDNNTDVNDVPLGEGSTYPRHANNAMREIMAQTKAALYPASNIGAQAVKVAGYTAVAADAGKTLVANSGSAIEFALTAAATLGDGWYFIAKNEGAGTLTINPDGSELIDGASTLDLATDESRMVFCDGTGFRTVFAGGSASGTIGGSTGSTDNVLLRADGTGGATLQASAITVDDSGNMSGVGTFNGYTPREVFTANRTYYVSTSGSDSNDGLTVGAPFATIQKAWNVLVTKDLNGFTATIKLADGTYTAGLNATVPVIGGPVVIDGNSSTPTNVLLGPTGSAIQVVCAANVTLKNFKLTSTIYGVVSRFGGVVYSGTGMEYGTNTVDMWRSDNGGYIGSAANFTISGGGQKGFEALRGGIIEVAGVTITLTGTPNYSNAFAKADGGTVYFWSPGTTWSGSATGKRYDAIGNGVVNSSGAATTWLPGSVAGTTSTGGQYV